MVEIHEEVYVTHVNRHMIALQIMRPGCYQITMKKDCIEYFRKYHKCQIYANKKYTPTLALYNMVAPWLFVV